jgi:hypothetical protein
MKTFTTLFLATALAAGNVAAQEAAPSNPPKNPELGNALLGSVIGGDVQQTAYEDFSSLDGIDRNPLPDTGGAVASGGVVAAGDLESSKTTNADVTLSNEAQSDAAGMNIVNGSESITAAPVNVNTTRKSGLSPDLGDGSTGGGGGTFSGLTPLDSGSLYVTEQQNAVTQSDVKSGGIGSYETFSSAVVTSASSSNSLTSNSEVDTEIDILGQKIHSGSGGAGSGSISAQLDGGTINVEPRIEAEGGGEVAWGLFSADVKTTAESPLTVELPELDLAIDGSGCGVNGGSCTANGSQETSDSATESLASAPLSSLSNVQGEYVALGDATITEASDSSVTLSDQAQTRARGVNVINAANGMVAAPVNVSVGSRPSIGISQGALVRQSNVVNQVR